MRQAKLELRSKEADLNIYTETYQDAEKVVREYLGETYGGLTESVLSNAEVYKWNWIDREGDNEIEVLRGHELPDDMGGGVVYETLYTENADNYLN